jgi:DNA mismatch endonuclease, patch repair protein
MLACRNRDTSPEKAVRSAVHSMGLRFRVATRPLPDLRRTADLVFRSARVAVHVDGCWWHGCPYHSKPAKTNEGYWHPKIAGNKARDADTDLRLAEAGWMSLRFWEHEDPLDVAEMIAAVVRDRSSEAIC